MDSAPKDGLGGWRLLAELPLACFATSGTGWHYAGDYPWPKSAAYGGAPSICATEQRLAGDAHKTARA